MRKRSLFTNREEEKDQDSTDAINLTPLIDMMFILLIFFVVTTSFVRETTVAIQRPKAATATVQPNAEVIVTISADEQVWLNNAPVDIRLLRTRLSESGNNDPKTSAIILADSKTQTGLLIEVMDQLRLAGFTNISVAANTAQTGE
jgi:biopolymer transport protein ExbD